MNLQKLTDMAYANGAYDDIDYSREPVPPLGPADAEWAAELLKSAGIR